MDDRKAKTPPASRKTQPAKIRRASELTPPSFNHSQHPQTPPVSFLDIPTQNINALSSRSNEQNLKHQEQKDPVLANAFEDKNGNESIVLYLPDRTMDNSTIELSVEL